MSKKSKSSGLGTEGLIASNRKARFEYEIVDTVECGIVLVGPEVKSLREGRANLGDAFAAFRRPYRSITEFPTDTSTQVQLELVMHTLCIFLSKDELEGMIRS